MSLKRIILTTVLSIIIHGAYAQIIKTKLDVVAGFGIPQYLHTGLRYQYNDFGQFGLFYGDDTSIEPTYIETITGEHLFHFGKNNYNSNRPVWYARTGLTYSKHTTATKFYKYTYIDLGAGRDFPITSWLGVNIDMGFALQVREKMQFKSNPDEPQYNTQRYWRGMMRLQVYYSF